ncbi:hypothetical protein R1flu_028938 [Riccia fluitans]|uniref:Uncharacterized protein n=1 Tax=Riccia fluitans TaxID=41844 RepID=A0ABD1XN64_9MARC
MKWDKSSPIFTAVSCLCNPAMVTISCLPATEWIMEHAGRLTESAAREPYESAIVVIYQDFDGGLRCSFYDGVKCVNSLEQKSGSWELEFQ